MYAPERKRRPERELDYNKFNSATKAALERREKSMRKRDSYAVDEFGYVQERKLNERQLDKPNGRNKEHGRTSRKEQKTSCSLETQRKSQKHQARLDYLDSQQFQTDVERITQQVIKKFAKDQKKRSIPQHSSGADDPNSCCKEEQVIQELKTESSKVRKEPETEHECSLFSHQSELLISNTCDELTCSEPVQPSSLVLVSQVSEEHSPKIEQSTLVQSEVLEQLISLEPNTIPKSLSHDLQEHCKELSMVNYVPEMFVLVSPKDVRRFSLDKVKELCVSNSVFDNMISSFKVLEPDKLSDQKRFPYGSDNNSGLVLSLEKFMEHKKSFDHHEKTVEFVLKQPGFSFKKLCDLFGGFEDKGLDMSFSKHKLVSNDLFASTCAWEKFMDSDMHKPKSLRNVIQSGFACRLDHVHLCNETDKPYHVLRSFFENGIDLSFDDILVYNTFFDKHANLLKHGLCNSVLELNLVCFEYDKVLQVLKFLLENYDISCIDNILVYNTFFDMHHEGLKSVLHVLRKESLDFCLNKNISCTYNTGYLDFVLSVQDQQVQSQRNARNKSKHKGYHSEIWSWKYLRKTSSKFQGSSILKHCFNVAFMFLCLTFCLVSNMFPFDVGDLDLRTNPFKGGGDDAIQDEPTLEEPEWMQEHEEDDMDQTQNEDVSLSAQKKKEDPFVISVGPITRSMSKKLMEKIICLIQSQESEEELIGKTTIPTIFIYSAVSYNN